MVETNNSIGGFEKVALGGLGCAAFALASKYMTVPTYAGIGLNTLFSVVFAKRAERYGKPLQAERIWHWLSGSLLGFAAVQAVIGGRGFINGLKGRNQAQFLTGVVRFGLGVGSAGWYGSYIALNCYRSDAYPGQIKTFDKKVAAWERNGGSTAELDEQFQALFVKVEEHYQNMMASDQPMVRFFDQAALDGIPEAEDFADTFRQIFTFFTPVKQNFEELRNHLCDPSLPDSTISRMNRIVGAYSPNDTEMLRLAIMQRISPNQYMELAEAVGIEFGRKHLHLDQLCSDLSQRGITPAELNRLAQLHPENSDLIKAIAKKPYVQEGRRLIKMHRVREEGLPVADRLAILAIYASLVGFSMSWSPFWGSAAFLLGTVSGAFVPLNLSRMQMESAGQVLEKAWRPGNPFFYALVAGLAGFVIQRNSSRMAWLNGPLNCYSAALISTALIRVYLTANQNREADAR